MPAAILHITPMTDRTSVRAITAALRNLAGVDAVEADVTTGCVTVWGGVSETALRTALADVGCLDETGPSG
jgi:copper chaperone CopZ